MNRKNTPGKLLLFGEYTVLLGSTALALPLHHLNGHWAKGAPGSGYDLMPFAEHLLLIRQDGRLLAPLDAERFLREVGEGLFFESNIPVGYGVGSSGALCAAIYERYASPAIPKNDVSALPILQQQLAQLEGFFHGQSSGADPLICYLQQPLLFESGTIRPVAPPDRSRRPGLFFLLDTGNSRRTAPLVQHFNAKCEDQSFRENALQRLARPTTVAVRAYLHDEAAVLEQALFQISAAQLDLLPALIPEQFHGLWAEGLDNRQFCLKLCGAGGGGFLIGYSRDGYLPKGISSGKLSTLPEV